MEKISSVLTSSFVLFFNLIMSATASADVQCTIKGKIIGRTSKEITLMKATANFHTSGVSIAITDSTFETSFTADENQAYALIFNEEIQKGAINR